MTSCWGSELSEAFRRRNFIPTWTMRRCGVARRPRPRRQLTRLRRRWRCELEREDPQSHHAYQTVRELPTRPEVAAPAYPRSASKCAWLLGGVHLGIHAEPCFQRFEVSPFSRGEAHIVVLLAVVLPPGGR